MRLTSQCLTSYLFALGLLESVAACSGARPNDAVSLTLADSTAVDAGTASPVLDLPLRLEARA